MPLRSPLPPLACRPPARRPGTAAACLAQQLHREPACFHPECAWSASHKLRPSRLGRRAEGLAVGGANRSAAGTAWRPCRRAAARVWQALVLALVGQQAAELWQRGETAWAAGGRHGASQPGLGVAARAGARGTGALAGEPASSGKPPSRQQKWACLAIRLGFKRYTDATKHELSWRCSLKPDLHPAARVAARRGSSCCGRTETSMQRCAAPL